MVHVRRDFRTHYKDLVPRLAGNGFGDVAFCVVGRHKPREPTLAGMKIIVSIRHRGANNIPHILICKALPAGDADPFSFYLFSVLSGK